MANRKPTEEELERWRMLAPAVRPRVDPRSQFVPNGTVQPNGRYDARKVEDDAK